MCQPYLQSQHSDIIDRNTMELREAFHAYGDYKNSSYKSGGMGTLLSTVLGRQVKADLVLPTCSRTVRATQTMT